MTVAEALKQSKAMTFMQKGSIKAAQSMLIPGEEIRWATICSIHKSPVRGELSTDFSLVNSDHIAGVIVVTERRIFFVSSSTGFSFSKEIRLSAIRSIDAKTDSSLEMLRFEALRIVSDTDMIVALSNPKIMRDLRNAVNEALAKGMRQMSSRPGRIPGTISSRLLTSSSCRR